MEALSAVSDLLNSHANIVYISDDNRADTLGRLAAQSSAPVFTVRAIDTGGLPGGGLGGGLAIESILSKYSDDSGIAYNFIIYCTLICFYNILYQVNTHEYRYYEQGVMTYLHKWLLVVDDLTHLELLEGQVQNITHLSAVSIHPAQQKSIYSAMWKPQGERRFEPSATVTNGSIKGEIFPNIKYGLNGKRLLVTNIPWAPFLVTFAAENGTVLGHEGICYELVEAMAKIMNFTYEIVLPPDSKWGSRINGTWNGMVKMMHDKTADMIAAPLTIEPLRRTVMDFTYPYFFEKTAILYRDSGGSGGNTLRKYFLFIMPFKSPVWICIILAVPTLGLVTHVLSLQGWALYEKKKEAKEKDVSLKTRLWEMYGSLFSQGMMDRRQKHLSHTVLHFWALTCVILTATYTGNLIAMLAVDIETKPFNSLEELIRQDVYQYGINGGTANANILQNGKGLVKEMWDNMVAWNRSGYHNLGTDSDLHLAMVRQGRYAYMGDRLAVLQYANDEPEIMKMLEVNNFPPQFGIGFQKNSAYKDIASKVVDNYTSTFAGAVNTFLTLISSYTNRILQLGQTGLLAKWEAMFLKDKSKEINSRSVSVPTVSTPDLIGLFAVFVAMIFMAGLIFMGEIWMNQTTYKPDKVDPERY